MSRPDKYWQTPLPQLIPFRSVHRRLPGIRDRLHPLTHQTRQARIAATFLRSSPLRHPAVPNLNFFQNSYLISNDQLEAH
jgi:hypothetical protein